MSVNVNSDNRVADLLNDLTRHMKHCRECQGAVKVRDYDLMCKRSKAIILDAVFQFVTVVPRRLKAVRDGKRVFYACPDLGAHPKAYAMTAEPLVAVGIQESLF